VASSGYHDDYFYVLVPNPPDGGSYTCQVPAVQGCIHNNHSTTASLTLDKLDAQLIIMDTTMKANDAALEAKVTNLENENAALKGELDEHYLNILALSLPNFGKYIIMINCILMSLALMKIQYIKYQTNNSILTCNKRSNYFNIRGIDERDLTMQAHPKRWLRKTREQLICYKHHSLLVVSMS
jgi:hypothetical protein